MTGGDGELVFFLTDADLFTCVRMAGDFGDGVMLKSYKNCILFCLLRFIPMCVVAAEGGILEVLPMVYHMISASAGRNE